MEAISRKEKILTGEKLEPISREEYFLAKIGGQDVKTPEPISRKEHFYQDIIDNGGIAGGNDGVVVTEDITITPTKSEVVRTRSSGKYINQVTVEAIPNEYIIPSGTVNVTENGTHNVKEAETVNVNVPSSGITPTGTLEVKENGKHDVTNYADVDVNVPIPDGYIVPEGNLEVTENNTYDVTTKKTVTVNVPSKKGEVIELSTDAEMTNALTADNVGKVYKFVGTSETYETGGIYIVSEVE